MQKLEIAGKIRALGNAAFQAADFSAAVKKYTKSLNWCNEEYPSQEEQSEINAARVPALLNRAACYLKLKLASAAKDDCNAVLKLEGQTENKKALFRRGQAYMELKEDDLAKADFHLALKLEPNDVAIKQALAELKKRNELVLKREKEMAARMFKGLSD